MYIWRVQNFQLLNVYHKNVSFPDSSRTQRIANEDAWKDLNAKLVELQLIFRSD